MHGVGDLRDQFRCLPNRSRLALDHFVKLASFDELHAEITGAIALAHFIDGNDARVIETGSGFGFAAKALQVRLARPLTKGNYL